MALTGRAGLLAAAIVAVVLGVVLAIAVPIGMSQRQMPLHGALACGTSRGGAAAVGCGLRRSAAAAAPVPTSVDEAWALVLGGPRLVPRSVADYHLKPKAK